MDATEGRKREGGREPASFSQPGWPSLISIISIGKSCTGNCQSVKKGQFAQPLAEGPRHAARACRLQGARAGDRRRRHYEETNDVVRGAREGGRRRGDSL